ncbi:MAG: glycosyltransferase family 39 protein, partial [Planctomycetota bacterium]
SMRPGELHLDPQLYQYGGLFIYPVGAAIALGGVTGLIEVKSDLVYYLDHPDEFGKFYVAARMYVALWGLLGVVLVYAITSRWSGRPAGVLAALLFTLMPVVVCMTHEAKPHLPGAVLMLAAVWWAQRYAAGGRRRDWAGLCLTCGAAFGMVLACLPIFVLIPLAEWMRGAYPPVAKGDRHLAAAGFRGQERCRARSQSPFATGSYGMWDRLSSRSDRMESLSHWFLWLQPLRTRAFWGRALAGIGIALLVYFATNPYVAINALCNRAVLRSNLSNSTAMYEIGRAGEGLVRVLELTVEGATLPVVVIGVIGLSIAIYRRRWETLPLVIPAGLIFVQFVLLGAGKPAEYARFGVFPNTALAIATACALGGPWRQERRVAPWVIAAALIVLTTGYRGWGYLYNFHKDARPDNTRAQFGPVFERSATRDAADGRPVVCVLADPAPYGLPPMNFSRIRLLRYPSLEAYTADPRGALVMPADTNPAADRHAAMSGCIPAEGTGGRPYSPISWANKPMVLYLPPEQQEQTGHQNKKARRGMEN